QEGFVSRLRRQRKVRGHAKSEVVADALVPSDGGQRLDNGKVDRLVDRALRAVRHGKHHDALVRAAETEDHELGWESRIRPSWRASGHDVQVRPGAAWGEGTEPVDWKSRRVFIARVVLVGVRR